MRSIQLSILEVVFLTCGMHLPPEDTHTRSDAHGKRPSDAGIVPYINASIILQLLSTAFPGLKKMQREGGPQVGHARAPARRGALCRAVVLICSYSHRYM